MPNVEVTDAARLYRAASVWTAGLCVLPALKLREIGIEIGNGKIDSLAVDQRAGWFDVAPNAARRLFMPTDIESAELWVEI